MPTGQSAQQNKSARHRFNGAELREHGFTLMEIMISVALLCVLMMAAAPNMSQAIEKAGLQTQIDGFTADLALTRSQAIKEGRAFTICSTEDGETCGGLANWTNGWLIYGDENGNLQRDSNEKIVRYQQPLQKGSRIVANTDVGSLTFNSYGFATGLTSEVKFVAKTKSADEKSTRCIGVSIAGRHSVSKVDGVNCP